METAKHKDNTIPLQLQASGYNNDIEGYLNSTFDFLYNEVTQRPEYRVKGKTDDIPEPVNDLLINTLYRRLNNDRLNCTKDKLRYLLKSDFCEIYNPFYEYFHNLTKWDGKTDHIKKLANTVKTTNTEFWEKALRRWLIAVVASILLDDVINHQMIVLSGPQGIGKTTWINKLIPDALKRYKYSGVIDPNNKDTVRLLAERMIIDVDELETLQKYELGKLKQIITKPEVSVRIQYDTYYTDMPRRASLIGSVNRKEFLTDLSGTRRFLCFDATEIDYQHKIKMDNVYAQALALLQANEKYWFDKKEIDEINQVNQEFQAICAEEELLLAEFRPCEIEDAHFIFTASEIVSNIQTARNSLRLNPTKMNDALRKNGFKEDRKSNGSRAWAVKLSKIREEEEDV